MITKEDLDKIRHLLDGRIRVGTHWDGCIQSHIDCAAWRLLDGYTKLQEEHAALKNAFRESLERRKEARKDRGVE